jgi:RNA-directed DNA polymerase
MVETTGNRMMTMRTTDKPFSITKRQVYEAFKAVKSNHGAAGVDKETIEQFEANLRGNLYKLWNRMSSGSYFPPPVRAVSIPKKSGGERILGVPTVADRVAQMVVKQLIEPDLDPIFLADSYGYPGNRRSMPSVSRVSAAGNTTGFWSSISKVCSTILITNSCYGLSGNT